MTLVSSTSPKAGRRDLPEGLGVGHEAWVDRAHADAGVGHQPSRPPQPVIHGRRSRPAPTARPADVELQAERPRRSCAPTASARARLAAGQCDAGAGCGQRSRPWRGRGRSCPRVTRTRVESSCVTSRSLLGAAFRTVRIGPWASPGREPHQRRVEVDVSRRLRGADARAPANVVLIPRPCAIRPRTLDACVDGDGELGSPLAAIRSPSSGGAPVLGGRRGHRGGEGEGAHVAEQRRRPIGWSMTSACRAAARRCGQERRLGDQQVVVEQIDERLEQAADARPCSGCRGDDRVGPADLTHDRGLQVLGGKQATVARRSRRRAGRARYTSPSRGSRLAQTLETALDDPIGHIGDGSLTPALITTKLLEAASVAPARS